MKTRSKTSQTELSSPSKVKLSNYKLFRALGLKDNFGSKSSKDKVTNDTNPNHRTEQRRISICSLDLVGLGHSNEDDIDMAKSSLNKDDSPSKKIFPFKISQQEKITSAPNTLSKPDTKAEAPNNEDKPKEKPLPETLQVIVGSSHSNYDSLSEKSPCVISNANISNPGTVSNNNEIRFTIILDDPSVTKPFTDYKYRHSDCYNKSFIHNRNKKFKWIKKDQKKMDNNEKVKFIFRLDNQIKNSNRQVKIINGKIAVTLKKKFKWIPKSSKPVVQPANLHDATKPRIVKRKIKKVNAVNPVLPTPIITAKNSKEKEKITDSDPPANEPSSSSLEKQTKPQRKQSFTIKTTDKLEIEGVTGNSIDSLTITVKNITNKTKYTGHPTQFSQNIWNLLIKYVSAASPQHTDLICRVLNH